MIPHENAAAVLALTLPPMQGISTGHTWIPSRGYGDYDGGSSDYFTIAYATTLPVIVLLAMLVIVPTFALLRARIIRRSS